MKVLVFVTLKNDVLDPEGEAIRNASQALGYEAVTGVRQGKLFELEIDAASPEAARSLAEELAEKLLANTVIENYRIERVEA